MIEALEYACLYKRMVTACQGMAVIRGEPLQLSEEPHKTNRAWNNSEEQSSNGAPTGMLHRSQF